MFTGLVETVGTVRAAVGTSPRRLTIASAIPPHEVAIGDSVAIDGCCLTAVEVAESGIAFEAATETLSRTTLMGLQPGHRVNLERALRLGDRLGGHLVSGHVDGIGAVRVREYRGSALYLGIEAPDEVARLTAARGSTTIAGVSLTVTDVQDRTFYVALIPHTGQATTLGDLQVGDPVNLEADVIARYVERLMGWQQQQAGSSLTVEYLKDVGFA